MPEMNDRRPRTKMRVKASEIQPGDHYEHSSMPGVMHPVTSAGPGMIETASGVKGGTVVRLQSGSELQMSNATKHTVHRLTGEGPTDGSVESMPQWATRGHFGR